ncbi:MAG: hypothetical protein QNI84_05485 [Henriciella sp.]|nr:hypothetical protein [Henriciella sp.]
MVECKVTAAFVLALAVQTGGALIWAGAAAQKIEVLEAEVQETRPVYERLARVEAELEAVRAQLDRIENKVERL